MAKRSSAKPCLKEKPEGAVEVPEFPGTFVTPEGRVYSFGKPGSNGEVGFRLRAVNPDDSGYLQLSVRVEGRVHTKKLHLLVCSAFHGPKPFPEAEARHLDGCKDNCSESNLAWGTKGENTEDRHRHGSYLRHSGMGNHLARLDDEKVMEIRERNDAGVPPYQTCEVFGISERTYQDIVYGRSWRHLLPEGWEPPPKRKGGTPAHRRSHGGLTA